jgi:hypothetical protein
MSNSKDKARYKFPTLNGPIVSIFGVEESCADVTSSKQGNHASETDYARFSNKFSDLSTSVFRLFNTIRMNHGCQFNVPITPNHKGCVIEGSSPALEVVS